MANDDKEKKEQQPERKLSKEQVTKILSNINHLLI